ncbi:MAG: trehalose-phosphatase [Deltaproteobacteria bacterium]|nr:trehalose-phosphatase [Deltaproteobacteria bacterium]
MKLAVSLPQPDRWRELASCPSLALLLDVDGTLVGFAATPEEAVLDEDTLRALRHVIDVGVHVAIVSGRPRSALEPLVEMLQRKIWSYAEHGAWHHDGTSWTGPQGTGDELDDLAATLSTIADVPGARIERKTLSICLHWRSVEPDDRAGMIEAAERACDAWMQAHLHYERLPGIDSLEVRRHSINKGIAVRRMRERLPDSRMIAIGDDLTDEDMFAELAEHDVGIAVGHHNRPSLAQAALGTPIDVRSFLHWIVDCRAGTMTLLELPA